MLVETYKSAIMKTLRSKSLSFPTTNQTRFPYRLPPYECLLPRPLPRPPIGGRPISPEGSPPGPPGPPGPPPLNPGGPTNPPLDSIFDNSLSTICNTSGFIWLICSIGTPWEVSFSTIFPQFFKLYLLKVIGSPASL